MQNMSNVTMGARARCLSREIKVEKKPMSDQFTIIAGKNCEEMNGWEKTSSKLKKLGCNDVQIQTVKIDLEDYYME